MISSRGKVFAGLWTASSLLLLPREATYCPRHFLVAATAYYAVVADVSRNNLNEVRRLRARELARIKKKAAAGPTRVQPGRRARTAKLSPAATDKCGPAAIRSASTEKKITKLMDGVGIPLGDDGEMMGMGEWKEEILRKLRCEMARQAEGRRWHEYSDRDKEKVCLFGSRPWVCEGCVEEVATPWKIGPPPTSVEKHPQNSRDACMQPEAEMPGPIEIEIEVGVEVEVQRDGDWGTVEVPTEDVVSVGGLRFVVDMCGGMMMMFV